MNLVPYLRTKLDNCRVEYFDSIVSTNAELVERIKNGTAECGDVVAARCQSAGRGRHGKAFSSNEGGVYFSFAVENSEGALVTVTAGVAVAATLESYGVRPMIKWVNDVTIGGLKVCGILAEAVAGTNLAVVGIGINLTSSALPKELDGIATSLDRHVAPLPEAADLIFRVIKNYEALSALPRREVISEYKARQTALGRDVIIKSSGKIVHAVDVGELGELIVTDADGNIQYLNSGEISISLS